MCCSLLQEECSVIFEAYDHTFNTDMHIGFKCMQCNWFDLCLIWVTWPLVFCML